MREVKFRAWDKELNRMIFQHDMNGTLENKEYLFSLSKDNIELLYYDKDYSAYVKHEAELMQYTGNKDKNGKEIYEGDIIECSGVIELIGVIVFKDCEYCIKHKYKYRNKFDYMSLKEYGVYDDIKSSFKFKNTFKIVGNIYKNKDLLEK